MHCGQKSRPEFNLFIERVMRLPRSAAANGPRQAASSTATTTTARR